MDRGIPTEDVLAEMRNSETPIHYLVGSPRGRLTQLEKAFPALAQEREHRLLVRGELVQTTIQIVRLHERDVLAEQIAHRAMLEPMPVQSPFAAGRNQLITDQRLQDVQPARSFARGRQRRQPKLIQSQLIQSGHPAGPPLTRTTQPHGAQPDRHHIAIEDRRKTILGKQRDLFGLSGAFIEDLDRLAPRGFLIVVDLSKIQYLPLNHAAILNAPVFDNRPRAMFLAVLAANLGAQKHDANSRLAPGRARHLVGTTSD